MSFVNIFGSGSSLEPVLKPKPKPKPKPKKKSKTNRIKTKEQCSANSAKPNSTRGTKTKTHKDKAIFKEPPVNK